MIETTLERSLNQVLSPRRLAEVRELVEDDCACAPRPTDVLHWMRLNMPRAAQQVEELATPSERDW